ncbi:MAG: AraC family transcriptional regulator [Reinekea sp.]
MTEFNASLICLPQQGMAHHHPFHQIVIGVAGQAECEVEGRGDIVDVRRACLVPSCFEHHFCGLEDNRVLVLDIPELDTTYVPEPVVSALFERAGYLRFDPDLTALVQSGVRELQRFPDDIELTRHISATLLLSAYHRLSDKTDLSVSQGRLDQDRLAQYVEDHLQERISIHQLAALVHLSPSHFQVCFRDAFGETPHRYVLQRRLDRAQTLILDSRQSLSQIAEQCGFSSQAAMSNAFRKHRHLTPGQLRRH